MKNDTFFEIDIFISEKMGDKFIPIRRELEVCKIEDLEELLKRITNRMENFIKKLKNDEI